MKHALGLLSTGAMLLATLPTAMAQSNYPAQPVRAIVTTAAGGGLDNFARLLTRELSARAGQQFFIDNRPGAGTTIGATAVARAKPDGYTLMLNTSAFTITPAIFRKIPYDPLRDFAPVTMGAATPNLLVVHPSVPVKSVRDLIALAQTRAAQGDPILYASGGSGTNGHLAVALFVSMAQLRMTHVPYRAGSLAVIDLIAGHVPLMIDSLSSVMPQVRTGKLRALGGFQRAARQHRTRHSDHRRIRRARLRVGAVVRCVGAGGHAPRNHRLAAQGNHRRLARVFPPRKIRGGRPRCGGEYARRVCRENQVGHRKMDQGGEGRGHSVDVRHRPALPRTQPLKPPLMRAPDPTPA